MKKTLCLILALVMTLALCACGSTAETETTAPAAESTSTAAKSETAAEAKEETAAPVDDTVYTLNYASTMAADSDRNNEIELVLKDMLYEKSNGRIVLEIFNSSTLAGNKDMLEALQNGIADMGIFLTPMYSGQFPYSELFSIPGLTYGTIEETDAVLREYRAQFTDALFETDLKIGVQYSIGTQQIISVKPVNTAADINGLTLRAASSGLPLYEALGASGVSMAASDVYEGLKLGTINATVTGMEGTKRNKLAEVADYMIAVPCHIGEEMIAMSWNSYNKLPADLQAVIDECFAAMDPILSAYTQEQEDMCLDACREMNPNLVYSTFSSEDLKTIEAAGQSLLEAKAAELDAAGLDGTGALQFLKDHAK